MSYNLDKLRKGLKERSAFRQKRNLPGVDIKRTSREKGPFGGLWFIWS